MSWQSRAATFLIYVVGSLSMYNNHTKLADASCIFVSNFLLKHAILKVMLTELRNLLLELISLCLILGAIHHVNLFHEVGVGDGKGPRVLCCHGLLKMRN